jgi:lactoylglutathione lyase
MTTTPSHEKFNDELWVWGKAAQRPRVLHTMVRVRDLDESLRFYIDSFGMKAMGQRFEFEESRASAVFIGYDDYAAGNCLELVKEWDVNRPYTQGNGYGHIAIGVPDVRETVERLRASGTEITMEPAVLLQGGPHVAFVKDPDGYAIELIETRQT